MSVFGKDYINNITSSAVFLNKDTSARLLEYLYETTNSKRSLKEIDIASEFFNRGDQFISGEDTIVRVNISKLRQLLRHYYQGEGANDEIRVSIPQRKYVLNVEEVKVVKTPELQAVETESVTRGKRVSFRDILFAVVLVFSLLLNVWYFAIRKHFDHSLTDIVWSDFSDSNLSNSLILGNPLFFEAINPESHSRLVVRDLKVNEPGQVSAALESLEGYDIQDLPYPYFSHNNVWALSEVFGAVGNENPLIIKTKTETTADDFSRGNVIFISNINTFGFVQHLLSKASFELNKDSHKIVLETGEALRNQGDWDGAFSEYGFFVKIPGENGNVIALIGDSNSTGIKGAVQILTEEALLEGLMEQLGYTKHTFPQYFEMIVKTQSYKYAGIETEVVHFKAL